MGFDWPHKLCARVLRITVDKVKCKFDEHMVKVESSIFRGGTGHTFKTA